MPWNTKEKKEEGMGGRKKEVRNKREKEGEKKREGSRE